MNWQHATTAVVGFLIVTASWCATAAEPPAGLTVDSAMESDPTVAPPPPKIVYQKQLKPLWLKALAGPEADLRREVAQMISHAHRIGVPGMKETAGALIESLTADDQRSVVRLEIARTLVVLDAKEAAVPLFELLEEQGLSFAQVVEPALSAWDHKPIRNRWMARIEDTRTRRGMLQLAIRGLGRVRETKAVEPLWKLVQKRTTQASFRLDAADALGRIQDTGLVERAQMLAADKTPLGNVDRLLAARLLSQHSDEATRRLLLELAVDRQPAVSAVALQRLLEINSLLVIPLTVELLKNPDANIRMLAARARATHAVASSVEQLEPVLNDPHPDVRRFACNTLFSFGLKADLDAAVRKAATLVLGGEDWRGQEQAALLMGALDHKPSAARLAKLLDAPREEVRIAAAWALRKLAVASTLPAMLARALKVADKRKQEFDGTHDEQLTQLMQTFGQRKYEPALEVAWRLIPKMAPFSERERVAAIWALGHIDLGGRQRELSGLLQGRLADVLTSPAEVHPVRAMSAVTLGRIKATDAVDNLRKFYKLDSPNSEVGLACRWAIQRITGERLPGATVRIIEAGGWRLAPNSK